MNLSIEDIKKVLEKNKIDINNDDNIKKINVGFTNESFNINDKYILKVCKNAHNENNFKNEIEFYNINKANKLIPKLIAYDITKSIIPYYYEIIEKIQGVTLYNVWHKLNEKERELIIKQICEAMKEFHSNKMEKYNFAEYIKKYVIQNLEESKKYNFYNFEELELINNSLEKYNELLASDEFVFVHNDLHFDNILVTDNMNIKIIDFERSLSAPKDFELDILLRMVDMPWKYASEQTEKYVNLKDYTNIKKYIKKYYSEIFEIENLEKRLAIYNVFYFIKSAYKYPEDKELKNIVIMSCKRILN